MKKEFLRFSIFISAIMGAGRPINSPTEHYDLLLSSTGFQDLHISLSLTPNALLLARLELETNVL